jgi:hypothetical protein
MAHRGFEVRRVDADEDRKHNREEAQRDHVKGVSPSQVAGACEGDNGAQREGPGRPENPDVVVHIVLYDSEKVLASVQGTLCRVTAPTAFLCFLGHFYESSSGAKIHETLLQHNRGRVGVEKMVRCRRSEG